MLGVPKGVIHKRSLKINFTLKTKRCVPKTLGFLGPLEAKRAAIQALESVNAVQDFDLGLSSGAESALEHLAPRK